MANIEFTSLFSNKAKKLIQRDHNLNSVFKKQFRLFTINPRYPTLHLHKLIGKRSEQFAISITGNLRALAIKSNTKTDTYIFFDIITHDEY